VRGLPLYVAELHRRDGAHERRFTREAGGVDRQRLQLDTERFEIGHWTRARRRAERSFDQIADPTFVPLEVGRHRDAEAIGDPLNALARDVLGPPQ
jgi:hypothetical protein